MPIKNRYDQSLEARDTAHILENQCKALIEAHHNQRRQIRDLAMTHNQFLELVREMRHTQRQYFKYRAEYKRSPSAHLDDLIKNTLTRSKELEKQVDQHLSPTQQQRLF